MPRNAGLAGEAVRAQNSVIYNVSATNTLELSGRIAHNTVKYGVPEAIPRMPRNAGLAGGQEGT